MGDVDTLLASGDCGRMWTAGPWLARSRVSLTTGSTRTVRAAVQLAATMTGLGEYDVGVISAAMAG